MNKKLVTLSGFSSGGTFAQQLYISHSSMFSGIGVFSHSKITPNSCSLITVINFNFVSVLPMRTRKWGSCGL